MRLRGAGWWGGVVFVAVGVAGCGAGDRGGGEVPSAGGERVFCHGEGVDVTVLEHGRPATELSETGRAAVRGEGVGKLGDLGSWTIVDDTAVLMSVIRRLPPGTEGGAWEFVSVVWRDRVKAAGHPEERAGWYLSTSSRCDLRRIPAGLVGADVELDPAGAKPSAGARKVGLLVTEHACVSGQSAEGRIRVAVERTNEEVRLLVGVVRSTDPKAWTCIGNRPTRHTAELGEALGNRRLVDATSYPSRVLYP
ncbi:hypothetical protein GCM10027589_17890 [Actinocorallia lasiicapitis]